MHTIDLRSDTVTLPTPAMKVAIDAAPLGDDVFEEDPTAIELETLAAEKLGKEAGLYVASGTMGNLVSILTHSGTESCRAKILASISSKVWYAGSSTVAKMQTGEMKIRVMTEIFIINLDEVSSCMFNPVFKIILRIPC